MLQEIFGNCETGDLRDLEINKNTSDSEKVILLQKIQERQ